MIVVKEIHSYGGSCPFQLEGITDKDEPVYARYRWGGLRVEVNGEMVFHQVIGEDQDDEEVLADFLNHVAVDAEDLIKRASSMVNLRKYAGFVCYDGSLTLEELKEVTKDHIQWPEDKNDEP